MTPCLALTSEQITSLWMFVCLRSEHATVSIGLCVLCVCLCVCVCVCGHSSLLMEMGIGHLCGKRILVMNAFGSWDIQCIYMVYIFGYVLCVS